MIFFDLTKKNYKYDLKNEDNIIFGNCYYLYSQDNKELTNNLKQLES